MNKITVSPQGNNTQVFHIGTTLGDITKRVEHFLTMDNPEPATYRTMEHLTPFDIIEFERQFKLGATHIIMGVQVLTPEDVQGIKGKFQKHRFTYAMTLWNGSNELGISGVKSKYALHEIEESNRISLELCGEELISKDDLEIMKQEINY